LFRPTQRLVDRKGKYKDYGMKIQWEFIISMLV